MISSEITRMAHQVVHGHESEWTPMADGASLETATLTESLSAALRAQIISGQVQPGLRLTEAWVAERFQVARPTAKSGLDRLTSEGLLRRGPRRSSMVPKLSAADVQDIYFSREPVESTAVSTLAGRGQVPPDAARALALMQVAAERSEHNEHTDADVNFHRALVAATASPRLVRMHQTVMGEAQLCIAQVRKVDLVDLVELTGRHAAIVEAIGARDAGAAIEALKADLYGCRDALLADIAQQLAG